MDNEKFQELVLSRFEQVFQHLKLLSDSVDTLAINQEKMQFDIAELKEDVATLKEDVATLKEDLTNVRQSQVRMEHDLNRKVTALFDFRDTQLKVNTTVSERLDRLKAK